MCSATSLQQPQLGSRETGCFKEMAVVESFIDRRANRAGLLI